MAVRRRRGGVTDPLLSGDYAALPRLGQVVHDPEPTSRRVCSTTWPRWRKRWEPYLCTPGRLSVDDQRGDRSAPRELFRAALELT